MTKEKVIRDYITGKIDIGEARRRLNRVEGERLVRIVDKKR